jgi:hypothetical protein
MKLTINLIFIIILLFFIIINYNYINRDHNHKENFDQRIDGATKEQCGIIATKTLGCNAFAYDPNNKYCFLSKDEIFFSPEKKAYAQFYNREFPRCNKLYMIDDPYYNSRNNIIRNATYKCMEKEGGTPEYKIYDTKEKVGINIEKLNLEQVDPYTFVRIEWNGTLPVSDGRFNTSLQVPVTKDKSNNNSLEQGQQKFLYQGAQENIIETPDETNDNIFSGTRPIYDPIKSATPDITNQDPGVINLDKNLHLITNPTKTNSLNIMKEYKDEFIGQYLYPHKCSSGISKEHCMKDCLNNKDCVGTEWNPILFSKVGVPNKYELEEGVCCPKVRIKRAMPRRKNRRFGHFYLKEKVNRQYLQEGEILVGMNKDKKDYAVEDLSEKFAKWKNNVY